MAQNYTVDCYDEDNDGKSDLQLMENNFECLRSMFSGSTEPSDIDGGVLWFDTVTKGLKIRNSINDGWMGVFLAESTTKVWMRSYSAEDGWVIDSSITDCVLALKTTTGTNAYNIDGGNIAGTWTQPGCTLTEAQTPSHDHGPAGAHGHTAKFNQVGSGQYGLTNDATSGYYVNGTTASVSHTHDSVGSGASHNHGGISYRPRAAVGTRQYLGGLS